MVIELKEPGREPRRDMNAKGRMMCPVCNVSLSMASREGVEIDFCPDCRGVWLDRGELDKIIERSVTEALPQQAPEPSRYYEEDRDYGRNKHSGSHGKHRSRRKSWLHELFD